MPWQLRCRVLGTPFGCFRIPQQVWSNGRNFCEEDEEDTAWPDKGASTANQLCLASTLASDSTRTSGFIMQGVFPQVTSRSQLRIHLNLPPTTEPLRIDFTPWDISPGLALEAKRDAYRAKMSKFAIVGSRLASSRADATPLEVLDSPHSLHLQYAHNKQWLAFLGKQCLPPEVVTAVTAWLQARFVGFKNQQTPRTEQRHRRSRGGTPFWFDRQHIGWRFERRSGFVRTYVEQHNQSASALLHLADLLQCADLLLSQVFPDDHARLKATLPTTSSLGQTVFTTIAVNHYLTDCHKDWGDVLCVIIFFGPERFLCLPELARRLKVRSGDVVILKSGQVFHMSEPLDKDAWAQAESGANAHHTVVFYVNKMFFTDAKRQTHPQSTPLKFITQDPTTWAHGFSALRSHCNPSCPH